MAVYLPLMAATRSQQVRIAGNTLAWNKVTYIDVTAVKSKREIQNHLAIGAVVVVGGLTTSNVDPVVFQGGAVTSSGSGNATVNIASGELKNRTTGAYQTVAAQTQVLANNASGNGRIDLLQVANGTGTVVYTQGTAAASPIAPSLSLITVSGAPTSGTFTLTYNSQTTTPLAFNASAATVQAALQALSSVGTGNATVSGSGGGPYTVVWNVSGFNQAVLRGSAIGLLGGSGPAIVVSSANTSLASVLVPNGFTGTSTVAGGSITDLRPRG